jgi:hypothetical protein
VKLLRSKKLLIAAAIVLLVVTTATTVYLAKPLPPPKVTIEFQSFKPEKTTVFHLAADTNDNNQLFYRSDSQSNWWFRAFPSSRSISLEQTNAYCVVYLTNQSLARIWWISMDCQVEAKTPNGWVTNVFSHFTTVPWSVGSSKKDIFSVYVPADAIEWRVTGEYQYYKHHNMRLEYFGWLVDDLKLGRVEKQPPKVVVYPLIGIGWVLSLLPESKEEFGQIHSELFTNRPPMVLSVPLKKP